MSAGDTRRALEQLLEAGVTGTYKALASAAGLPQRQTQAALKEMRRCGLAASAARSCERSGRRGRPPVFYAAPVVPLDPLAFTREAWR